MNKWTRVTKAHKCPICKHDSWCLINTEVVMCMRVASERSKTLSDGTVAYIHRLTDAVPVVPRRPRRETPVVNCAALLHSWALHRKCPNRLLASKLGVSTESLDALGCVWASEHNAWAFPFRNGWGAVVGIQLRYEDGFKRTMTGTHNGLLIPQIEPQATMYVVEGTSDTAAAVTMGLYAVGRPSCSGGLLDLVTHAKRSCVRKVVIVSDNDGPGRTGAMTLANHLPVPSCMLLLPSKDIRAFYQGGGTADLLTNITAGLLWKQP